MIAASQDSVRIRFAASSLSFLAGGVCALLVQVAAVRELGTALYGQYATVIAAVTLLELTVLNRGGELALESLGSTWTSGRWGNIKTLTSTLLKLDLRWAFGGYAVLLIGTFLLGDLLSWQPLWLVVAGLAIPIQAGYGADKALLIVSGEIAVQARSEVWTALSSAALSLAMLYAFGALGLVGAYVGSALIKVLIFRRLANAKRRALPQEAASETFDSRLRLSAQMTTTTRNIVSALGDQVDVMLLNALAGPTAAGTYKIAKSLATLPARAIGPVWASLRPELVASWFSADRSGLRSVMFRPTIVLSIVGAMSIPLCWFFAGSVVSRAYGIDGSAVIPAMTVLLAGSFVYSGLAGWYKFMMLLDADKWRSLRWSAGQALWVIVIGYLVAARGPAPMALVVAIGQLALSALAVVWLLRSIQSSSSPR